MNVIFRAKDFNDRWLYGDMVKFGGRYQMNVHEWNLNGELSLTSVRMETLEIHLGKTDEQGRRIFHKIGDKKNG